MTGTQFGKFKHLCDMGTLPVCNLFDNAGPGCTVTGLNLSNNRHLTNLGSILCDGIAVIVMFFLLWRSDRKKAAVGRREMQLFLLGYIIISICEIFTVGGIPLNNQKLVWGFSAAHLAAISATFWILLMNGVVGYQLLDDGTPLSIGLIVGSALAIFVGTGYIALDTGFDWTGHFNDSKGGDHLNYGLYVLYILLPLICVALFFLLESVLVIRVLGETKPMLYLLAAAVLFAAGQIFNFTVSSHICYGSKGKINGTFFQTLLNLLAVVMTWVFWSSITEDDWPMTSPGPNYT